MFEVFPVYPLSVVTNSSFVFVVIVEGSESLSWPFTFVIFLLASSSNSSEIQARFVRIWAFVLDAFAVTVHSIWITSDAGFAIPVYGPKFVLFPSALLSLEYL